MKKEFNFESMKEVHDNHEKLDVGLRGILKHSKLSKYEIELMLSLNEMKILFNTKPKFLFQFIDSSSDLFLMSLKADQFFNSEFNDYFQNELKIAAKERDKKC